MKDKTLKIIELINQEKTCNEICKELNITNKLLFYYLTLLENQGKYYKRKYYSDGEIFYEPITKLKDIKKILMSSKTNILLNPKETELETLVISDLHLGNEFERLDLLEKAYSYCKSNNIHIILCCGDIIDGTHSKQKQKIKNIDKQLDYLKKYFPTDPNILVFAVGGDHDHDSLACGQDMITVLRNYRHDIVMNTYNDALLGIKNDKLQLYHKHYTTSFKKKDAPIIFHGHHHLYRTRQEEDGTIHVIVPSLSNINQKMPSAIQATFKFDKAHIDEMHLRQIYFSEHENILLSQVHYNNIKEYTKKKLALCSKMNTQEEIEEEIQEEIEEEIQEVKQLIKIK